MYTIYKILNILYMKYYRWYKKCHLNSSLLSLLYWDVLNPSSSFKILSNSFHIYSLCEVTRIWKSRRKRIFLALCFIMQSTKARNFFSVSFTSDKREEIFSSFNEMLRVLFSIRSGSLLRLKINSSDFLAWKFVEFEKNSALPAPIKKG